MERFPVVSVFIVVSCFQRFLMTSSSILEEMIYPYNSSLIIQ